MSSEISPDLRLWEQLCREEELDQRYRWITGIDHHYNGEEMVQQSTGERVRVNVDVIPQDSNVNSIAGNNEWGWTYTNPRTVDSLGRLIEHWNNTNQDLYSQITEQINEEDIMEEIELVVEKKKRTRKPKQLPDFYIEKIEGGKGEFDVPRIQRVGSTTTNSQLFMCPYTTYIPIDYIILSGNSGIQKGSWFNTQYSKRAKVNDAVVEKPGFITEWVKMYLQSSSILKDIINAVRYSNDDFMLFDRNTSLSQLYLHHTRSSFDGIKGNFRSGDLSRYGMRTYRGFIGTLSIYSNCYNDFTAPECLLVTAPENYLYQKYQLLLKGTIDVSKCFLLVNRELDSTSHPNKNFRAMFNKFLLPIIEEYNITMFKVPQSFIIDNCYTGNFKLQSRNIFDRKKEIETITKQFLEYGFN